MDLQYVVWKEGMYYVSQCLNVEVSSFGESKAEAITNLNEAIELYFEGTDAIEISPVEDAEVVHAIF